MPTKERQVVSFMISFNSKTLELISKNKSWIENITPVKIKIKIIKKFLKSFLKFNLNLNNDAPIIWVNKETGNDPTIKHIISVLAKSSLASLIKKYLKKKLLTAIESDEPYEEKIKILSKLLISNSILGILVLLCNK